MSKRDKEIHVKVEQLNESGYQAFQKQDHLKATDMWLEAVQLVDGMSEPDFHLKGKLLFNLGLTYSKRGHDEEAIHFYKQAVDLSIKEENACYVGKTYMGLGQSFRKMNDLDKAIAYTELAIVFFQRQNDPLMAERARINCGLLYRDNGRIEEAAEMLDSSLAALSEWNCTEEVKIVIEQLIAVRKTLKKTPKSSVL